MKITVLGCGTSGGVPRLAGEWGACDPQNPKNLRRRVSILVEEGDTKVIVDTSPDLRMQLLDANIKTLDAVFYTHDHADHTHGIDDLRSVYYAVGGPIDIYADARTLEVLDERFNYIFKSRMGYPAICTANEIGLGVDGAQSIGNLRITAFEQQHGPITSLGYLFEANGKRAAYSTDLNGIPPESDTYLEGLDLWVVDALRYKPHPTHPHLDMTLDWIARYAPRKAVLTHMTWDMDYETVLTETPAHVQPGFDGLVISV